MSGQQSQGGTTRDDLAIMLINAGIVMPVADFIREVRDLAGFRVSPRQVTAAVEALGAADQKISAEAVADIVTAVTEGDKSQRQRRNSTSWLELGAVLKTHGLDGSPEGQRRFVAGARRAAGRSVNDALILRVSLTLAGTGMEMNQNLVGRVARQAARYGHELDEAELFDLINEEARQSG